MGNWQNVTLGDIGRGFARYRPFIAVIAGVVLVAGFLGGEVRDDTNVTAGNFGDRAGTSGDTSQAASTAEGAGSSVAAGGTTDAASAGSAPATGGATRAIGAAGGSAAASAGATQPAGGEQAASGPLTTPAGVGPDCDPATGRIRVPSLAAPPCHPMVAKGSGKATWQGVTPDAITVVWYRVKASPAVAAALSAAGAADEWPNTQDTVKVWADLLSKHWNLHGRHIDLKIVEGVTETTDDAGGRRDAIDLADKFKPFAVINSPNNSFVDELVGRKILCICTTSQPQEFYESRAPYAGWTTLMSSTQGYIHRAEYVGKRLAGQKAKHAGYRNSPTDPMNDEERVFGLLYYETPDRAYASGVEFFKRELARYGVQLKVALAYPSDLAQAQQDSRSLISRLKAEGVTSVIFSGDFLTPATFTAEADNQQWHPEWIITGSALTDTALFARTYHKDQWNRAFGISFLALRVPREKGESWRLHEWHAQRPPAAENTQATLYAPFFIFGTGVQLAGPNLTPETFGEGLFSYPLTGGRVTAPTFSYGRKGIWDRDPWNLTDFTLYDDVAEIWWDPSEPGPDEVGNNGVGLYRFVDNGKRYMPGTHPASEPRVFDKANAPTILAEHPANEKPPAYGHEHFYGE